MPGRTVCVSVHLHWIVKKGRDEGPSENAKRLVLKHKASAKVPGLAQAKQLQPLSTLLSQQQFR